MKTEIAREQSLSSAKRMLELLCESWILKENGAYSAVYMRRKDGVVQERTIEKLGDRKWIVVETEYEEVGVR